MKTKIQKPKKKKKTSGESKPLKQEGFLQEFLNQIAQAAYAVALKTGFRGNFIRFLSELQEALDDVIREDREKRVLSHLS